ncbi:hypothetical protein ZIOFF_000730 [Zingiber officinale]|uniref:Nudix hydrolase 3 n=1 Tax=Zingiber officinale TaxID=94328 RepID=A0A8J5HXP8_ZINOF|nr:hypothetical protein ZIOFF_000730 [Zingiber officinale]
MAEPTHQEEHLDVLTKTGEKTGVSKPRSLVHRDGDYHRAVHVWIYSESTQELLLQKRADCKASWPAKWDISSAGHISSGESSLLTARNQRFLLSNTCFGMIINIFLKKEMINMSHMIQQASIASYLPFLSKAKSAELNNELKIPWLLSSSFMQLIGLSEADKEALFHILRAAIVMDDIFYLQVWHTNPMLRDWLKERSNASEIDRLKWMYYSINKSPWSCLDENEAFLTTADSLVKLLEGSTKPVTGWKGIEYKVAFPLGKPPGANFYPLDMDKKEFELWKGSLTKSEQEAATGFFSVIRRQDDIPSSVMVYNGTKQSVNPDCLTIVPYSQEYRTFLEQAAQFLFRAAELSDSSSLTKLLKAKGNAFLSNNYYESDIAWMELDSKLDVTIGPYETYEDTIFGYKVNFVHSFVENKHSLLYFVAICFLGLVAHVIYQATFEAFVGIRDDKATTQVKLFGDHLQVLEQNLPMDDIYKSKDVVAAPIRVIHLIYNSGVSAMYIL